MKKRIVFFDDDCIYGSIIDQNLKKLAGFVYSGWYLKFDELCSRLKKSKPDYLLIELPTGLDLSLLQKIKRKYASISIIIISSKEDYPSIQQALKAGADGYLIKHMNIQETMHELHKLSQGGVALSPAVARRIVRGFWKTNNSPLTRTETKVLKFVSLGHSYSSVASNLDITKETAKTHLKNIYKKLDIHKKSEALERAYSERLIN